MACFHCHKVGHLAKDCRDQPRGDIEEIKIKLQKIWKKKEIESENEESTLPTKLGASTSN